MVVFIHCIFCFFSVVLFFYFLCVVVLFCLIYNLQKRMSVSVQSCMYGYTYTLRLYLYTHDFTDKDRVTTHIDTLKFYLLNFKISELDLINCGWLWASFSLKTLSFIV